jgi:hypothetical protein
MNLHPEIQTLLSSFSKKGSINIEEKQLILKRAVELDQNLKYIIEELDKIEKSNFTKTSELIKCEACGELIPTLDRVCPSCRNVKNSSGSVDLRLDDLIFETESILSELKSSNSLLLSKRILKHSSISFPFLIGCSFILGWNFNSDVLAGVFFWSLCLWLLVIRRLKRNLAKNEATQNIKSYQVLHSQIENKLRLLALYFGNDGRTKDHLFQLKNELKLVQNHRNKLIVNETIIYLIAFALLFIVGYFTVI